MRVLMLGATGTIGRATVPALRRRGHDVVCVVRPRPGASAQACAPDAHAAGATVRLADIIDPAALARDGFRGERFDALVSCLASRTGEPSEAWAIDHRAHADALALAGDAGVSRVVLLSAICVQRPRLAFQHAKLAFERALVESGIDYAIVRPTAYFKSLSGQIARVRRGAAFLVFGDGTLTACKPIADEDLADYLSECVDAPDRRNRVLPIGGPGDAITPRDQGEQLFMLLGKSARFRHVPVAMLDAAVMVLGTASRVVPALSAKAEYARIGRYYATESMLVFDHANGRYDATATPSTGRTTLFDHYARVLRETRA